jgi:hypothetical protein
MSPIKLLLVINPFWNVFYIYLKILLILSTLYIIILLFLVKILIPLKSMSLYKYNFTSFGSYYVIKKSLFLYISKLNKFINFYFYKYYII